MKRRAIGWTRDDGAGSVVTSASATGGGLTSTSTTVSGSGSSSDSGSTSAIGTASGCTTGSGSGPPMFDHGSASSSGTVVATGSGARHAVSRLLVRREAEGVDELRAVHSARLEGVLLAFWPAATSGDTDAARIVLRTLDSLAKLFGLDAPTRVAVGAPLTNVGFANEAARLIESIASMGGTDDLLRSLPDGAGLGVIAARQPAALDRLLKRAKAEGWLSDDPLPKRPQPQQRDTKTSKETGR